MTLSFIRTFQAFIYSLILIISIRGSRSSFCWAIFWKSQIRCHSLVLNIFPFSFVLLDKLWISWKELKTRRTRFHDQMTKILLSKIYNKSNLEISKLVLIVQTSFSMFETKRKILGENEFEFLRRSYYKKNKRRNLLNKISDSWKKAISRDFQDLYLSYFWEYFWVFKNSI